MQTRQECIVSSAAAPSSLFSPLSWPAFVEGFLRHRGLQYGPFALFLKTVCPGLNSHLDQFFRP